MSDTRFSRLGPLCGALFAVLELGGFIIGSAGGRAMVTLGDPGSKVLAAFAEPAGTAVWIGAYLELLALAAFTGFATWLFRSRPGPLATAGLITAGVYVAVTAIALVVGDVLEYRAGHGLGAGDALALFDLQSGLFISTWGISAAFLALAPVGGALRWTALAIAALSLIGMATPTGAPGQIASVLFLLWSLAAGFALAVRPRVVAGGAAVARPA
jgi:hypothetical protein